MFTYIKKAYNYICDKIYGVAPEPIEITPTISQTKYLTEPMTPLNDISNIDVWNAELPAREVSGLSNEVAREWAKYNRVPDVKIALGLEETAEELEERRQRSYRPLP